MKVTVHPSKLNGNIKAPTSKSAMQRACAASLLAQKPCTLYNIGKSNDDIAALGIIKKMGATIEFKDDDTLKIDSSKVDFEKLNESNLEINCGESGLSIRMFTPIAALFNNTIHINGEGSLTTRPMNFFDEILPQLSVNVNSNNGKLPLQVTGPLQPKDITIDGSLSSQFLTGLLMAFAKAIEKSTNNEPKAFTITVNDLKSKPYIDLTLQIMQHFDLTTPVNVDYEEFIFERKQINNKETIEYTVEGDWSGAAFLIVAATIAGSIIIEGMDANSTQADKAILKALDSTGVKYNFEANNLHITQANLPLPSFAFDATDCPDLFPPLVALASFCKGTTVIKGVNRLAHKESNRGLTLQEEFGKLGIEIALEGDFMKIKSSQNINGATVYSHHDHRIAMACAVAALKAKDKIVIENADAINKSYPTFYQHLQQLGATIENL
ncbi:MAG: 3-phosphoshikimate 1-carboxyvinyltransferase [Chitinophagaceae bacterium]